MKKFILGILITISVSTFSYEYNNVDKTIYSRAIEIREVIEPIETELKPINDFEAFQDAIGFRESSDDYKAINKFGYIGRYQFGKMALKDVGIDNTDEFIKNPDIQDAAFLTLCSVNQKRLKKYISKYVGKTINGIEITESGMIAASHLVGAGSVKKYLRSNGKKIRKDGNGTSLEHYLELFGNYDLKLIAQK